MATILRSPLIQRVGLWKNNPLYEPHPPNLVLTVLKSKDKFFGSAGQPPTYDYPTPPARTRDISLLNWTQPVNLNLLSQDRFFDGPGRAPVYDYPTPPRRPSAIENLTWTGSLRIPTPAPFAQYDYPLTVERPYNLSLRTWTHPTDLTLRSQDQFFTSPGQGPNYDWPLVPKPPKPSIDLLTWTDATKLRLITHPLNIFGTADAVPNTLKRSSELSTWVQPLNLSIFAPPAAPIHGYVSDLPQTLTIPVNSRTWLNPLQLNTITHPLNIFGRADVVPYTPTRGINLSTWTWIPFLNLLVSIVAPIRGYQAELPLILRPSASNRTWLGLPQIPSTPTPPSGVIEAKTILGLSGTADVNYANHQVGIQTGVH